MKKKNSVYQNIVDGWKRFENLPVRTMVNIRRFLLAVLLFDMFIVIWYFKQKSVGIFIFLILIAFLSLSLLVERRRSTMSEEKPQEVPEEPTEEKVDPDAEKYADDPFGMNEIQDSLSKVGEDMRKELDMEKSIV